MLIKILLLILLSTISNLAQSKSAPWVGNSLTGDHCKGKGQGFGPYDYSKRYAIDPNHLKLVESAHFVSKVENLISGNSARLVDDLDYTLRAWPNHHKALLSVIRYQLQINMKIKSGKLLTPPECYLQRAIHFSPKDPVPYSLYAFYLKKLKKYQQAEELYKRALKISPNNAKLQYSYGLLLIKLKRYKEAYKYAKQAYANSNPPNGLKKKLIKLKVWK